MNDQDLDRHEPATPHKLRRARERGQLARSAEVASAVVFGVAVLYLMARGLPLLTEQFRFDAALFGMAGRLGAAGRAPWPLIEASLRHALQLLAPFLALVALAAMLGHIGQNGVVWSFVPLRPDWNRLNPVQGLRRAFSARLLFHTFRAVLKLALLGAVAGAALLALASQFQVLGALAPLAQLQVLLDDLARLGVRMAAALGAVALVDLLYARRAFAREMRMSRREIKEEHRQREGDPRVRGRLRMLRQELLRRSRSLGRVREADVVIVNPTHLAVALRYEHGVMTAPQVLAKGAGAMAAAMRQLAARHAVPVVRQPALARQLFRGVAVDQQVPPQLHADVARVIVWVFAMREARRAAASAGSRA